MKRSVNQVLTDLNTIASICRAILVSFPVDSELEEFLTETLREAERLRGKYLRPQPPCKD